MEQKQIITDDSLLRSLQTELPLHRKYTSGTDEYTKTYTPSANNITAIKCSLYQAGGTTVLLDSQTIVVVKDGGDGTDGRPGTNGVSVVVTNSSEVIPCNTSGNASVAKDIAIPFYGFSGITRLYL